MKNVPLPAILTGFNCTRNKFARLREHLNFTIEAGSPGVTTMLTRPVALDLAFVATLTRIGWDPKDAAKRSKDWVDHQKNVSRYFIWNPAGTLIQDQGPINIPEITDSFGVRGMTDMPMGQEPRAPAALVVIDVHEIIDRVEAIAAQSA